MARPTLVRPPTEQITDDEGQLTPEWSEKLDELFALNAEQQNTEDSGSSGLTEEQVNALITTALADVPIVRTYTEEIAVPAPINTIQHNLNDPDPMIRVFDDLTGTAWTVWLQPLDENSFNVRYTNPTGYPIRVAVWSIVPAS